MVYELFISRASPYSSKVLALLGYAEVPHQVRVQNALTRYAVVKRLTGRTMVPVLRRGRWAINDSTEIARYIMRRSPRPTLPAGQARSLAWLLEDFADEWMVRWMVHSRWQHREDARRLTDLVGQELTGYLPVGERLVGRAAAKALRRQMFLWGVRAENDAAMEGSALRCLEALELILSRPPKYLFASYPTVADFAIFGALVQYSADPTGHQRLALYPVVRNYIRRLEAMTETPPKVASRGGVVRDLAELQPLFAEFLGTYWTLLVANYQCRASQSGRREVVATLLDGTRFETRTSSYLQGRLEALLSLIDETYARQDRLFGEQGLRMERALIQRIGELCESPAGRGLLQNYEHVGMH